MDHTPHTHKHHFSSTDSPTDLDNHITQFALNYAPYTTMHVPNKPCCDLIWHTLVKVDSNVGPLCCEATVLTTVPPHALDSVKIKLYVATQNMLQLYKNTSFWFLSFSLFFLKQWPFFFLEGIKFILSSNFISSHICFILSTESDSSQIPSGLERGKEDKKKGSNEEQLKFLCVWMYSHSNISTIPPVPLTMLAIKVNHSCWGRPRDRIRACLRSGSFQVPWRHLQNAQKKKLFTTRCYMMGCNTVTLQKMLEYL